MNTMLKPYKKIFLYIAGVCILSFALLLALPKSAAILADYVARPLLGSKTTLALEGIYFSLQDKLAKHGYRNPTANHYEAVTNSTPSLPLVQPPTLSPQAGFSNSLEKEASCQK